MQTNEERCLVGSGIHTFGIGLGWRYVFLELAFKATGLSEHIEHENNRDYREGKDREEREH